MVTVDEVRRFALTLPRTTEGYVRGCVKFYVGRIVYFAFSRDETELGWLNWRKIRLGVKAMDSGKVVEHPNGE